MFQSHYSLKTTCNKYPTVIVYSFLISHLIIMYWHPTLLSHEDHDTEEEKEIIELVNLCYSIVKNIGISKYDTDYCERKYFLTQAIKQHKKKSFLRLAENIKKLYE